MALKGSVLQDSGARPLETIHDIAALKEQHEQLQNELDRARERTAEAESARQKSQEALLAWTMRHEQLKVMHEKQDLTSDAELERIDKQVMIADEAKGQLEQIKQEVSDLKNTILEVQLESQRRINEGIAEIEAEFLEREQKKVSASRRDREAAEAQTAALQDKLLGLSLKLPDLRSHSRIASRRTALLRLGRAAATWRSECEEAERELRRNEEKSKELRRLAQLQSNMDHEISQAKHRYHTELEKEENEQAALLERYGEKKRALEDEVALLKERASKCTERTRLRAALFEALNIAPISESQRIRQQAEALSLLAEPAQRRMATRGLVPELGGDRADVADLGARSKSAATLGEAARPPRRHVDGFLRGIEAQIALLEHRS